MVILDIQVKVAIVVQEFRAILEAMALMEHLVFLAIVVLMELMVLQDSADILAYLVIAVAV